MIGEQPRKPVPPAKHWRRSHVIRLTFLWGHATPSRLMHETGKRWPSILAKARQLGLGRGHWAQAQLLEHLGICLPLLLRGCAVLGIRGEQRTPSRGGQRLYTVEQAQQLEDWLVAEPRPFFSAEGNPTYRWALSRDCCRGCKTSGTVPEQRHRSDGYCVACFRKVRAAVRRRQYARRPCG